MPVSKSPYSLVFDPALYFGVFLFLVLTSLHHQWPFTSLYNIEYILLPAGTVALVLRLRTHPGPWPWRPVVGIWLVGFVIGIAPVFSHALNHYDGAILSDSNWRSLMKIYAAAGGTLLAFYRRKTALLNVAALSMAAFAVIFLVHRFVYNEVEAETLRPILNTTHGDPNFIASLLVAGLPMLAYLWLQNRRLGKHGQNLLGFGAAVLSLTVIVLTESRMALIAMALAGGLALWRVKWPVSRARIIAALIGCIVIAGALGGSQVVDRFQNLADDSNQDRVRSIENGWVMFQQKPFFGHGMHSAWRNFYKNSGYGVLEDESRGIDIHNAPMQVLAELGLVGLGAHLVMLAFAVSALIAARRQDPALATLGLASLISLGINMLSLPMAHQYIFHQWLLVIVVSAWLTASEVSGKSPAKPVAI